jgi:geranylgeranyl pyrophosphate synthase
MDNIRALVNNDINTIENNIYNLINSNNDIIKDIQKFINGPSKRVRSIICLLYLKANNLNINKPIIKILSAGELIHNASLLHDDVIDNSDIRRGEIAFHKKYDTKTSILSGDYLLSIAVKELLELKRDDIIQIFLKMSTIMLTTQNS